MRTKPEIIRASVPENCLWEDILYNTPFRYVEAAMDEYAKEVALDMLKWNNKIHPDTNIDSLWEQYQQEKRSLK